MSVAGAQEPRRRGNTEDAGAKPASSSPAPETRPAVSGLVLGVATADDVAMVQARAEIAQTSFSDAISSPAAFAHFFRVAETIASSTIVPKHFQGKANDVFVGLHMAVTLKENPLTVLQNLYVVHGTPAFKSQFLIARANVSGLFKAPGMRFDVADSGKEIDAEWDEVVWSGDKKSTKTVKGKLRDIAVTAWAIDAASGQRLEYTVSMADAIADGWVSNAKYRTLPKLMLTYRAAAFLVRIYAPQVMLGMGSQTAEEAEDDGVIEATFVDTTPKRGVVTVDSIQPGASSDPGARATEPAAAAEAVEATEGAAVEVEKPAEAPAAAEGPKDAAVQKLAATAVRDWTKRLDKVVPADLRSVWFGERQFKGVFDVEDLKPGDLERFEAELVKEEEKRKGSTKA